MLYNAPTGAATADEKYVGKNVAAGQQGSKVPPGAIEFPQREIVNLIVEALLSPTNDDLAQMVRAIRSGRLWTFTDISSVPNRIVFNPRTPHTSLFKGLPFRIWPALDNTAAVVTIVINGVEQTLTRRDNTGLLPGDVRANIPIDVVHDGSGFRFATFAASEVARNVANPIVYVRGVTGSDSAGADGSRDTPDKAFKSLDAALLYGTSRLAYSGSQLTINLTEQTTYAAPQTAGAVGTTQSRLGSVGSIKIVGGNGLDSQDAYVVSGTGYPQNSGIVHISFGTNAVLQNLRLDNQNPAQFSTLSVSSSATCALQNVTWSGLNGSGLTAQIYAPNGAQVRLVGGCKATNSMGVLWRVLGGAITLTDIFKFVGALNFPSAVLMGDVSGGSIQLPGGSFDLSQGSVAGTKYQFSNNSTLQTFGQGLGILPGTANTGALAGNATAV